MSHLCVIIDSEINKEEEKMRIYKKEINGMMIEAHNDSNAFWSVGSVHPQAFERMSFDKRKYTMKRAMEFYASFKLEA